MYKYMKIKGFYLREVTSFPKSKNVMNMVHHSTIAKKKKTHPHHIWNKESLQHRPVSLTIEVLLKF